MTRLPESEVEDDGTEVEDDPEFLTAMVDSVIEDTNRLLDLLASLTGWDRDFFVPLQCTDTVH